MQTTSKPADPSSPNLRMWPAVVIVALQWIARFVVPLVAPDAMPIAMMGSLAAWLALVVWWVFFSRAPWTDRLIGLGAMVAALAVTRLLLHPSIATAGMGVLYFVYAVPPLSLGFLIGVAWGRSLAPASRRIVLASAVTVACLPWALARTGGISNEGASDLHWRWTATAEDRLVADEPAALATGDAAVTASEAEWPGFRGPDRDSVVRSVTIGTDWATEPPTELWRQLVGPGWSSFAVHGDRIYTQEQRGEDEVVSCYDATSGAPVWHHRDPVRFWEANAGAGPRGTPTIAEGRIYTLGATGLLNVLDERDGRVIWSRQVAEETATEVPTWGFSGSPTLVDDLVVVAIEGKLAAYDRATGEPSWVGPDGGLSYSSPHLAEIDGVKQLLLATRSGLVAIAPTDGTVLWEHSWRSGTRIVQPWLLGNGEILLSQGVTTGLRRLSVSHGPGWQVEEDWTTNRLKPYFSDFVVHRGHAYGFDGNILASIDVETGERNWKGGRYGSGQMLLLADQDLLLVVSEKGEIALVGAAPESFRELARVPALDGKTWNHPVVVGDRLFVRNSEEMAAFRLPSGP